MDLGGDDVYRSGHYSQGAALCGYSLFYEGGGDDLYSGDLGVQCFSIFGYSIFIEKSGRDTYECSANGQASASTLGVSILAENDGDDMYRAGGKYGFYFNWDSSCAQGAASGMRSWPPTNKYTLYGGIGFLSERSGRDVYHAYNIGQGGSYMFALGMFVDSEGNDTYSSERYCRGVGVHLSAAVALDRNGNDLHNGFYGQNGYSLDRSSGVFVDFEGNDIYRTSGGIGFGHKPKGCGIFVDFQGNDTYAGWENNYGKADWPFGDEAYSTGFFLDEGGRDVYLGESIRDNTVWQEGEYGYGEDAERNPDSGKKVANPWKPAQPEKFEQTPYADTTIQNLCRLLNSDMAMVRFTAMQGCLTDPEALGSAMADTALKSGQAQRRQLIDIVHVLKLRKQLTSALARELVPLLDAADYDMRLLGLQILRESGLSDKSILDKVTVLALKDDSWEVRGMACTTLGALKQKKTAATLMMALKDTEFRVRRRAAMGLAELKNKEARSILLTAMKADPAFQVRAYAAQALGNMKQTADLPALKKMLMDPSEFVRCMTARTLLLEFSEKSAMTALIDLIDWPNGPMKDSFVTSFLRDYTGRDFPTKATWLEWWIVAEKQFNPSEHKKLMNQLTRARDFADEGNEDKAVVAYRKIFREMPDHQGMTTALSEILNGRAWNRAAAGTDLDLALSEAQESVRVMTTPMNLDTLAVIYYLTGHKDDAEKTILKAIELAKEDPQPYRDRLKEFQTGKLVVR
jgi:HEAT repeat protein